MRPESTEKLCLHGAEALLNGGGPGQGWLEGEDGWLTAFRLPCSLRRKDSVPSASRVRSEAPVVFSVLLRASWNQLSHLAGQSEVRVTVDWFMF